MNLKYVRLKYSYWNTERTLVRRLFLLFEVMNARLNNVYELYLRELA